MCIIVVKPFDQPLPSKEIIKICFENNADGAGYMYRRGGIIHIVKGFFDVEALWKSLQGVKDEDVCIHFRWATHGAVNRGNCHPFPLTKSVNEMRNTRAHCTIGIAHNGIISGMKPSKIISDTMVFIKNIEQDKKLTHQFMKGDGKFCVMTSEKTLLIGDFIYDKGCYYSNDGFRSIVVYKIGVEVGDNKLYLACMACQLKTCEGCPELDIFENGACDDMSKYVDMVMAEEAEDAMLDADMDNELLDDEDDLLR
jgi:hypothetical protein